MKIFFSSTSYPSCDGDWKGVFIQRMLEALQSRPDLRLTVWAPPGPRPFGVTSASLRSDENWLQVLADRGGIAYQLRSQPLKGLNSSAALIFRLRRAMLANPADVYHLNWLQSAIALPKDGRPALITALGTDMQLLNLPAVSKILRLKFSNRRVAICPNAEWMVEPLERAFHGSCLVKYIPFGIDSSWYEVPRNPLMPNRWLCVSRLTPGKLGPLFQWAETLFKNTDRELHLIGPKQDAQITVPQWVNYHGPLSPHQLRETWFREATGLLSLSTHPEGRPQVMLEAMAAGLPIIASTLPAHVDLLRHGETGWLCDGAGTLADGIATLENPALNEGMGHRSKEFARNCFGTWEDNSKRYAAVYDLLCSSRTLTS